MLKQYALHRPVTAMLGLTVLCGALALVAGSDHLGSSPNVPEIPAYLGARNFQRTTDKDSVYGRPTEKLSFETDDDRPVVEKFYSDYLLSHGWYTPPGCEGWIYFYGNDHPPYTAVFPYQHPTIGKPTQVIISTTWGLIPCDVVIAPHFPEPQQMGLLTSIVPPGW